MPPTAADLTFVPPEGTAYPTADGRQLTFTAEKLTRARVILRNSTRFARNRDLDPFNDRATDVLATDLVLADADGLNWRTTARFDSHLLVTKMLSPGADHGCFFNATRFPRGVPRTPYTLRDVLYFNDDHIHRLFPLQECGRSGNPEDFSVRVARLSFKHLLLRFDLRLTRALFLSEPEGDMSDVYLRVRLHPGCAFDRETETEEDLGPLAFQFPLLDVFREHRYATDNTYPSDLALPLVFERVRSRGKPQKHVRVE